uniref:Uncharacterized protein n=1 Tax=Panagrolaimus sp. PS1159 TaxID=55785 RepID=A0AC35FV03_9BILA
MHCQKLNLCGYQNLICNYDREQPSCGGKNNFVSHVNQITPTGPVSHVCCELQHNSALHVPNHDGNDCFVYELPDGSSKDSTKGRTHGSSKDSTKGRTRKQHSIADDEQLTVLQNAAQIPEQIDGITGYRMKLFMLRNKSPPSLIVKAIERLPDGYRVTICRPRCGNFVKEGEIGRNEKTVKAPIINIGGDIMHGKVQSPAEWAAASWSAWSSSSWTSWSSSKLIGETSAEAKARGQIRGDRNKIEEAPNGGEDKRWGSGWNSGKSEGSGWPTGSITNNVNVHANGGSGGLGGVGGEGQGGAVNGVHGGNAGAVAVANGSGAGVGVVAIDGGGDGGFGKAGAGKKGNAGGNGNAGGEGGANSGLGGGNNGNGSEGPDGGDTGKSKAGGKTPNEIHTN